MGDVIDAAKHIDSRKYLEWAPGGPDVVCPLEALKSNWYVRAEASADELRQALGSVKLLARSGSATGEAACLTEEAMSREELDRKLSGIQWRSVFRLLN